MQAERAKGRGGALADLAAANARQFHRVAADIADDALGLGPAQQDALRRIALEQAAAAQEETLEKDDAALTVDELERGMRIEFTQLDGSVRKVKLAWVSPRRSLFIFSSGLRQESFSLSADKLLEAVRAGRLAVLALEGVVGRVLTAAMQDAVNDPAPPGAARQAG